MTAPAHYAIGAASALFIQKYIPEQSGQETRIFWALMIAVVSHVVADAIPHAEHILRGRYLFWELVVETVVMLIILLGSSSSLPVAMVILAGMAGAAIPDGLNMLGRWVYSPTLLVINEKIHFFHGRFNLFYANLSLQFVITTLLSIYVHIRSA